ncbi:hypothetical protein BC826DRAFT_1038558 [Russula brevipes]|nr:hypothetical protein BC826DRAFT_1038558 [Russula brevipes]
MNRPTWSHHPHSSPSRKLPSKLCPGARADAASVPSSSQCWVSTSHTVHQEDSAQLHVSQEHPYWNAEYTRDMDWSFLYGTSLCRNTGAYLGSL